MSIVSKSLNLAVVYIAASQLVDVAVVHDAALPKEMLSSQEWAGHLKIFSSHCGGA
jgi:hypothetical protein